MERYLYTATSGSGIIPIDAIVNMITGRTKMLKKAIAYEKLEIRKNKYLGIVSEERLISDYSIPKDYTDGFAYYVSNDKQMNVLLDSGVIVKDQIISRTNDLAFDFLELIEAKQEQKEKEVLLK